MSKGLYCNVVATLAVARFTCGRQGWLRSPDPPRQVIATELIYRKGRLWILEASIIPIAIQGAHCACPHMITPPQERILSPFVLTKVNLYLKYLNFVLSS